MAEPRRREIAADLADRIRAGDWAVGDPLPTLAALAAAYRVHVSTVQAALGPLRAAGVVEGAPGVAVLVRRVPAEGEVMPAPRSLAERVAELEAWRQRHEAGEDH